MTLQGVGCNKNKGIKLRKLLGNFQKKDLSHLKYLLEIKVANSKEGITRGLIKYITNL